MSAIARVALIGFGEVGQALAHDLARAGVETIAAWDLRFATSDSRPSQALGASAAVGAPDAERAVRGAGLVISAVTAAQCCAAAEACAPGLKPGALFLDVNSASPHAKAAAAAVIETAGGRYVEAAVMSPIEPKRLASPMLLGGPHAAAFLDEAAWLGFSGAVLFAAHVGKAAAAKLCRSVMIKGIEALLIESLLAARYYEVEDTVLTSLSDLLPMPDWPQRAHYMIARALEHGARRAEEMREAAVTVREAGLEPLMSRATALRQDWAAAHREALSPDSLTSMLDTVLNARSIGREEILQ